MVTAATIVPRELACRVALAWDDVARQVRLQPRDDFARGVLAAIWPTIAPRLEPMVGRALHVVRTWDGRIVPQDGDRALLVAKVLGVLSDAYAHGVEVEWDDGAIG